MTKEQSQKRNRLIALTFASVLLLLVYGPLAQWFIGADRVFFDQLATHLRNAPLQRAVIVSVDPSKSDTDDLLATYGSIMATLKKSGAKRIILSEPPALTDTARLPGWSGTGISTKAAARLHWTVPVTPTTARIFPPPLTKTW